MTHEGYFYSLLYECTIECKCVSYAYLSFFTKQQHDFAQQQNSNNILPETPQNIPLGFSKLEFQSILFISHYAFDVTCQ